MVALSKVRVWQAGQPTQTVVGPPGLVEAPATAIDPQTGQGSSSISDIRLSLSSWRLTLLAMIAKEKLKSSSRPGGPAPPRVPPAS